MLGAVGMLISGWRAPAHLLPSLVVADLKIFSAGTAHIGRRYAGKLPPDVERFLFAEADRHCGNFRHAGPATRAVRLSVSAGHELWTAFRAKP